MRDLTTGHPPMIGTALSIAEWQRYVEIYDFGSVPPSRLVLHHTWNPTVSSWRGKRSMQAMQRYYAGKHWRSAPHIYVGPEADKNIWLFTPMRDVGVHAGTGNCNPQYIQTWRFTDLQWYSIGIELVGDYDKVKPSGPVLAGMRAVLGGLSQRLGIAPIQLIAFHRDYTTEKSCPGWAVTKDWVFDEVTSWLDAQRPQGRPAPLLGPASGTVDQAMAYLTQRADSSYTLQAIREIVTAYQTIGERVGLDWFLALSQLAHETGNLTSFWSQRPQRNPAGIGVDGRWQAGQSTDAMPAGWAYNPQRQRWEAGCSFRSWAQHAVPAHLGRLLAYALRDDEANPPQWALIDQALTIRALPGPLRGCAKTIRDLDGRWAVGQGYGARVQATRDSIVSTVSKA